MNVLSFLVMLLALSTPLLAQVQSDLPFQGQNGDVVQINQPINVTRPVPYNVPSTCYNQIPYQSYECHNETRYRQQCHWIPESERCWNENERVCRSVPETRQVCENGPDREVCHEVPQREVCIERPTREICHTNPQGQRVCNTVGGGRECHMSGGGRQCDTVPGARVCHNETHYEQECQNVPRRQCERVPGRNDCDSIPYQEQVCGNETRYRSEPYACTKIEYRDVTTPKALVGEIDVRFLTHGLNDEFALQFKVDAPDAKFESFAMSVKLLKDPKVVVILKNKSIQAEESEDKIQLKGEVLIEVVEASMITPIFPTGFKNLAFDKESSLLSLEVEGGLSAQETIEAQIVTRPWIFKSKTVAQFKGLFPSPLVSLKGNVLQLNLASVLEHKMSKKNDVSIKLTAPVCATGEILNLKKPELSKTYQLELLR